MMNKPFTLAVSIVVLATVMRLTAAQRISASEQPAVPTAGPPPNDVKLSDTRNVGNTRGCPMTAWVHNGNYSNSGYLVSFYKVPPGPNGPIWTSASSNATGKANLLVPWGTKVVATVQSQQTLLTSNVFNCPAKNPHE
jgi:hypothetical protein